MNENEYRDYVILLIRQKYDLSEEIAILRQKDSKPTEYQEYYNYVESCKTQAKEKVKEYEEWKNS